MTSVSQKLEGIRKRLMELDSEAWGPDSSVDSEHDDGKAGSGGAENVSDINDTFIAYMLDIAASVEADHDLDADSAVDFVFDAADSLAEEGSIPFIPSDEDLAGTAEWLGTAKMMGFGDMVCAIADSEFGEGA